ncbi:MAG: hypothetical protein FJ083_15390 [Cyanobacteria bacterium K_Offshore_surface_m2_239]|nr:hypothetical protein [Cyanobacteria bacterium K_Offshore_surface_m2_239]
MLRLAVFVQLQSFRAIDGSQARADLLLPTGTSQEWLTADVLAVPLWRVLSPGWPSGKLLGC